MPRRLLRHSIQVIFYGNIFYGICAVALCIETNLFHEASLNVFPFYLLIFLCTWLYYTMIYVRSVSPKSYDERTLWYRNNLSTIQILLKFTLLLVTIFLLYLLIKNHQALRSFTFIQWVMILTFPLFAALYTFKIPGVYFRKLRQIGWLKPFVVGFTWSGWVTVYPLLIWQVQRGYLNKNYMMPSFLFWLQNFLFISVLAIIFDIKDHRTDLRNNLNTYPAKLGIRNTFRYVIYPVTILNIFIFFLFQSQRSSPLVQTIIQTIPYVLLVCMLLTRRNTKSVLYYLVVVDGLMFLKAICGIISISFFK